MLLSLSNVAKHFGVDIVLESVTFRLDAREKVAMVGRNGTGKTTLLKILTGQYAPDAGSFHLARGAKVGYLRQETQVDEGKTVLEEAQTALADQLTMRKRLEELEAKLEHGATDEDLEEYALLHEHFLESEGYSAERDIRTVLIRMGFEETEFDKPTAKLSGGERTRLAIARLLLEEPDLLILDEPTNHLDLQATEWLEGWIRGYHGAVLLVSHDRAFLENTVERVLELKDGTVKSYPGNFTQFLRLRAEEDARQVEVAKLQDREIAKMDEFVRRFMNSQRTAQARGRQKIMNRMIEGRVEAPKAEKGMKGGFEKAQRSGEIVIECEKLAMAFGDETLFNDLNWVARYGERWGVVGENGSGKSTLMKIVLSLMDSTAGRAKLGAGVVAGYFRQDGEDLDPSQSPMEFMIWECDMEPPAARNLLGRFLISGDDAYRPIKTMSGGEKNKLSLARLTNLRPNLLILDEPTNHLDMASREALVEILKDYKGTLILVSHDRHLLGEVTDHTLDMRKAGPVIYPGSYTEYRARLAKGPLPVARPTKWAVVQKPPEPALSPREMSKEISRLEKLVEQLERQVAADEKALKDLEHELGNLPPTADVFALTQRHAHLQDVLAGRMSAWEETALRLEVLVAARG